MKIKNLKPNYLTFTKICMFLFCGYVALAFLSSGVAFARDTSGTSALYAVHAYSSSEVWAVGYRYENDLSFPLVEHWDGTRWSIVPNPPNVEQGQMHGVAVVAPDDVWIVGATWNTSDQAYVLHWDGTRLQSVPCQNPGLYGGFWAVAATAANDVWAVGDATNSHNDYNTMIQHWDGTSWKLVRSPTGEYDFLQGVAAVSANDIWTVGYGLTASEILHWDGARWSVSPSGTVGDYAGFRAVSGVSANDVWAVGFASRTLVKHWDGTQWNFVSAPAAALFGLEALAANDVWAVGEIGLSPRQTAALHWNGSSWIQVTTPSPGHGFLSNTLYAISAAAPDDIWAVGIGQQALTIHWDGNAWQLVHNPGERVR